VQLHYHEEEIQKARKAQRTPEQRKALREKLRPRAKVERKIAELVRPHGLRQGRYFGEQKTDLQAVFTATMANAKRLFTLSVDDADPADSLRDALAASSGPEALPRRLRLRLNQRLPNDGHGSFVNVKAVARFLELEAVIGLSRGDNLVLGALCSFPCGSV